MDKEELGKIARTIGEYAYNRPWEALLPEHKAVAHQVTSRILEDLKELGYHKPPELDRPKLEKEIIHLLETPPVTGRTKSYAGMVDFSRLAGKILALIPDKLPKEKPPLLSDEEIERLSYSRIMGRYKQVAQAQREADIKHYETHN